MLVTERDGRLRVIRNGVARSEAGRRRADHPPRRPLGPDGRRPPSAVCTNSFVYLSYAKPLNEKETATAIARGHWNGTALTDVSDVFVAPAGVGGGARMAFGRDGTLYVTTGGGGGNSPQDPNSLGGKVLRLKDDGTIPS